MARWCVVWWLFGDLGGEGAPRGKVGCLSGKVAGFVVGGDGIYMSGSTCTTCTRDRLNCL
jgi:hypothetical protein